MCKKLILLTLFLAVLGLTSASFADDVNPPDFAGADGTGVAFWEFDLHIDDEPDATEILYNPEVVDPWVNYEWYEGVAYWEEADQMIVLEGYDAFMFNIQIPDGEGPYLTAQYQITFYSETHPDDYYFLPMAEAWDGPDRTGEYNILGTAEGPDGAEFYELAELGDGMYQMTYLVTGNMDDFGGAAPFWPTLLIEWEPAYVEIYEVILDACVHPDPEPPVGPGRGVSDIITATNPRPGDGATEVDADAVTELVWDDPNATVIPDPNYDVWVNGSNTVVDSNSYTVALDWGTEYIWQVDVINEPAGDVIAGAEWMFTTGGIPSLIWPEDADWWIHTPVDLDWEGDIYAEKYNLYVGTDPNDPNSILDGQEVVADSNYVVTGLNDVTTYYWMIEEVNTALGGVIGASETWSFETYDSTGKPYDDWLGAGHTKDVEVTSNNWEGLEELISDWDLTIESMTDMTLADVGGWIIEAEFADPNIEYPLTGEPNDTPWVMLDLGHDYDLWLMWLWNCNDWTPDGIDEYTVHYVDETGAAAEDPNAWSWAQVGDDPESLAQAPYDPEAEEPLGLPGYTGSAGPSFEGTTARYVVVTVLSGLDAEAGWNVLSRLKLELEPRLSAYGPTPGNHETDVEIDTDLSWYAGLEADGHDVYLSDELIGEKDISLTITWQSPNLVPGGESWGWGDTYWLEWGYDMNTAETVDGNWKTTTIEFSPDDNPTGEGINLMYELGQKELIYIDKVVIDTDCNPTFAGGQTHAEWVFDTNGFEEVFADVYDQNEGGDDWAVMSWLEGGPSTEHLATYDGKTGVWALDANGWAEMSFELGNFAETEIPYLGATGGASDVTYGDNESLDTLDLDTTYYWRVDEVNNTGPSWKGNVWEFTTALCVSEDDFESYETSGSTDRVYDYASGNWGAVNSSDSANVFIPGSDPVPDSGNAMGIKENNTYAYEGSQSMRMNYTWALMPFNAGSSASCYAQKDLGGVDLAGQGATTVSIAYLADAGNPPDSTDELFVELEDTSANVGRVVVGSIAAATDWTAAEVAIQDFNDLGVDESSVQYLRIGATTGKTESDGNLNADMYVDAQIRCAPACLASSSVAADLSGPDGEPDCLIDAWDLAVLTGEWLSEDYYVTPEIPADGNELVEYLFASDLTDTSGDAVSYDGVANGDASVSGGALVLDGIGDSVEVGGTFASLKLFDGNSPFTIAMDFTTAAPGMLISSARPQGALGEEAYGDTHSMALFAHNAFGDGEDAVPAGVSYDTFWVAAARALDSPMDGAWHTVVMVFDANTAVVYLDGVAGEMNEALDPAIPGADADTTLIGSTLNTVYPAEIGVEDFDGEIDNVRIYQQALTAEEALYLTTGNTTEIYFGLDTAANLSADEAEGEQVINFKDYAELMKYWLGEYLLK